jgi:excisionase family DNA binding protein
VSLRALPPKEMAPRRPEQKDNPFAGIGDAFAALIGVPAEIAELKRLIADLQRDPDKELLTIKEAAERYSLSESKIYKLVARGEIKALKIDRSKRIAVTEMRRWIATKHDV